MRKINMKKLNNKGFTLIELLAVIVILAVVMGVATTSVLSAMNNSRKSSLQNSAASAADAFRTSYAEYSLGGERKLVGYTDPASGTKTNENLLKGTAQPLTNYATGLNITSANYNLAASYVKFDVSTSAFTVCLVATNSGSYYVAAADITNYNGTKPTMSVGTNPTSGMWACSDNKHSWK